MQFACQQQPACEEERGLAGPGGRPPDSWDPVGQCERESDSGRAISTYWFWFWLQSGVSIAENWDVDSSVSMHLKKVNSRQSNRFELELLFYKKGLGALVVSCSVLI